MEGIMEPKSQDISQLASYEEEWVALTKDLKVKAHHKKLEELRKQLGHSAQEYSYLFVPPLRYDYISFSCQK